jgi:hypothetical protein
VDTVHSRSRYGSGAPQAARSHDIREGPVTPMQSPSAAFVAIHPFVRQCDFSSSQIATMDAEGASNKQAGEITQHQSPSVYEESLEKPEVQTRIQTQRHLKSRHVQLMVGFPIEDPPPPILTMITGNWWCYRHWSLRWHRRHADTCWSYCASAWLHHLRSLLHLAPLFGSR